MKWNERAITRKVLTVVGLICVLAYFVLTLLEACNISIVPTPVPYGLMGAAFLCQGLTQAGKKKIWGYSLAAGWFLVAVLYCF